jgi:hemerythrin-like domain-containing protein
METPEQTFVEALHQEHSDLFRELQKLEEAVGSGSAESLVGLGTGLGNVRTHLTNHFRFEEQGGYMAPLLKEEPRFGAVVRELLDEHRQLAQTLDALIQELRAAPGSRDVFRERVRAWVSHVRQHESRENNLVQEAYYSSGATGD